MRWSEDKGQVWPLVAASRDSADIATQTGCCSALTAQQDQWEWRAAAEQISRQTVGSRPPAGSGGEGRMEGGGCISVLNFLSFQQRLLITRPVRLHGGGSAA